MNKPASASAGPRALRRGLAVLRAIQKSGPEGLLVAEIATVTDLDRATVYRLVQVLMHESYVATVGTSKRLAARQDISTKKADPWRVFIERLRPALRNIAVASESCVFLVRRDHADALCLDREIGPGRLRIISQDVGDRLPLGVGVAGVALLAALPDATVEAVLDINEANYPMHGALNRSMVESRVENTRARGYAVVQNYALKGILGVGCAVHSRLGHPLGAVGVTTFTERMPVTTQRRIARLIQEEIDGVDATFKR